MPKQPEIFAVTFADEAAATAARAALAAEFDVIVNPSNKRQVLLLRTPGSDVAADERGVRRLLQGHAFQTVQAFDTNGNVAEWVPDPHPQV